MGWDCTLHLVDPSAIAKTMARLAQGKPPPPELLAAYERGEDEWAQARERLSNAPPDEAALFACRIAILSAAASHPHHDERGVALSFAADPTPRATGPWIPQKCRESPEVMMTAVVKKRPELAGRFHGVFQHNADTGVFVPAKHVAEAADVVRRQLFDRDVPERERYWGLYRVLRAAARHGLAYWEATDLPVANTCPEMIPPLSTSFEWLEPTPAGRADTSCAVVDAVVFVSNEDGPSFTIDAQREPDRSRPCPPGLRSGAARLAGGQWVAYVRGELRVYDPRDGAPHEVIRTLALETAGGPVTVRACGAGAVIVPSTYDEHRGVKSALYFDGEDLRPIEGLPAPKRASRHGAIWYGMAATTLGCGNAMITWNARGYEIESGAVVGDPWTLDLAIEDAGHSIHPWGDDGFYFSDDQTLRRVRRGAPPETVAKLPDVIRGLGPGPDGSVLVGHAWHPKKRKQERAATLVFVERGEEIALHRDDVELAENLALAGDYLWGRARKEPTGQSGVHAFRVATADVLALPRGRLKAPKR